MATSVDSIIATTKAYADSAIGDAEINMAAINQGFLYIESMLQFMNAEGSGGTNWDYTEAGTHANSIRSSNVADNPDTLDSALKANIGNFLSLKPLTYPASVKDITYVKTTLIDAIDDILAMQDRFTEAIAAFEAINTFITLALAGTISGSATSVLAGGSAREALVESSVIARAAAKWGQTNAQSPGSSSTFASVGQAQIADVVIYKTLELQRSARKAWLKIALESATAQSDLNKDKYTNLVGVVDSILELGKAEVEEGDIEFKINELKFRKDQAYSKAYETIRAAHFQRWQGQFGIAAKVYSVLQQSNVAQFQRDRMAIEGSHDRVKLQLEEFKLEADVRSKALTSTGNIYSQKISGALSSLNTLVGQLEELTAD